MEILNCECSRCDLHLGELINLWSQIGRKYFSPIVTPDSFDGIAVTGPPRFGEAGTIVGGCELQDIACSGCNAVLGLKCLNTPVNYVLDDGQILLRLASISLTSPPSRAQAKLVVKRLLKLRDADSSAHHGPGGSPPGSSDDRYRQDSVDITQLQASLELQQGEISRLDSAGYQIVSAFDSAVDRIENEVKKIQGTLLTLRKDLDGHCDDFSSLKSGVTDLKAESKQASTERKRLKDSIGNLKSTLAPKDAMSRLENDVKALKGHISELTSTAATEDAVNKLEGGLESTSKAIRDLKQSSLDRVADLNELRRELTTAKDELQDDVGNVRREIGTRRMDDTVGSKKMGSELKKSQEEIKALRGELSTVREESAEFKRLAKESTATAKEYAREMAGMRHELKQLKQDVDQVRTHRQDTSKASISSKELDILTSSISKIGNRASQVETLQMEFQLFKSRLQRIESAQPDDFQQSGRVVSAAGTTSVDELDDFGGLTDADMLQQHHHQQAQHQPSDLPSLPPPPRRKRNSSNRDATIPDSTSPNKRRSTYPPAGGSEDEADALNLSVRSSLEWPPTSSPAQADTPTTGKRPAAARGVRPRGVRPNGVARARGAQRTVAAAGRGRGRKSLELT